MVLVLFFALALIFFARLVYLQVIKASDFSDDAQAARTTIIDTSPRRGTIYDRNGVVLATSIDAVTIYANPHEIDDVNAVAAQLTYILQGEIEDYLEKLSTDTYFVYIKRKADADQAQALEDLGLKGIYFIPDTKRVYPNNHVGGQVIGVADVDGEGIAGLELFYDDILRGTPGKLVVERGLGGIPIPGGVRTQTHAEHGQDIIISLDIGLQEYLETRLAQGVDDIEAVGGNALVYDASTGEILACASLPFFNPSDTSTVEEGATQLKSVTDAFEPGSIFKTVSMAAILEANVLSPDDNMVCPAILQADEYYVSDAHERGDEVMSLQEILARSSNVGISLSTQKLGFRPLYQKIIRYNLNSATGIDYPGESHGYLLEQNQWSLIQSYNVSFGQGVSVTPVQMARFYGVLVNEGVQCTPHFLIKKVSDEEMKNYLKVDIIDNKTMIPTLTKMLESVVTEGTAQDISIEGYAVAGKTGTAEIARPEGGYREDAYHVSFVGYLPHSNSQLVCFVGATEVPADRKVTQIFQDIMAFAIDRYKISPNEG
ncbi:MAG: penicillin-binding protein 2 [Coriobacteriaceae bacterium]|jgi:cell division protein FtsI (penicillin-binding protein 3)|nr:penicillin-binding protein 2 [Coriobacteriaceae bacterium]